MAPDDVAASVNKPSFVPGETIRLTLHFEAAAEDLGAVSNVSVNFYRVETERNQFAFAFGSAPIQQGNTLELTQALPETIPCGLYLVHHVNLSRGDTQEATVGENIRFDPIFFVVRTHAEAPLSNEGVNEIRGEMEIRRAVYTHQPIKTSKSKEDVNKAKSFRVFVFGVGCLLHSLQQLDGYYIMPLGSGLSHRRMHEIVNALLEHKGLESLDFNEETEKQFGQSTPTFLVSYETVVAVDHNDALDHCRSHANLIFQILGLDRGQMPREFACMAFEYGSNQRWHLYEMPGYKGNLISDFNPVSTANQIERLLPRLQVDSFARLLMKTYAEATAEGDYGFSLLRYWSILELVGDKSIPKNGTRLTHPDGTQILNPKGNPETTNSKRGRVYSYILANGGYKSHGRYTENGNEKSYIVGDSSHPGYTPTTELLSLWDLVSAVYAIRNAIAHEGQFDLDNATVGDVYQKLAARLRSRGHPDPLNFIKLQAQMVIWREV